MAKISCFYNCGASNLTLENIEEHYRKFHTKLKSYYRYQDFRCDSCLNYFSRSLLYSPARNSKELITSPHYCPKCAIQSQPTKFLKSKNMKKSIKKTKRTKTKLKLRKTLKTKKAVKKSTALTLTKNRSKVKNTPSYYNCLLNQAKSGFKGKITKACQACKTNAPALNLAYKKEASKLVQAYKQLGVSLSKILSH